MTRADALRRFQLERFLKDDGGQAVTEYILLLSVVVGAGIALKNGIITAIDKGILLFGGQLEKDLKSGRAPVTIWTN